MMLTDFNWSPNLKSLRDHVDQGVSVLCLFVCRLKIENCVIVAEEHVHAEARFGHALHSHGPSMLSFVVKLDRFIANSKTFRKGGILGRLRAGVGNLRKGYNALRDVTRCICVVVMLDSNIAQIPPMEEKHNVDWNQVQWETRVGSEDVGSKRSLCLCEADSYIGENSHEVTYAERDDNNCQDLDLFLEEVLARVVEA